MRWQMLKYEKKPDEVNTNNYKIETKFQRLNQDKKPLCRYAILYEAWLTYQEVRNHRLDLLIFGYTLQSQWGYHVPKTRDKVTGICLILFTCKPIYRCF